MTATDRPVPSSSPPGTLYDARRRVHYVKPVLRGWLHLLWFAASLVAGPLLVARGHGPRSVHAGVAAGALMLAGGLLYVAGALFYHWRRPDPSPSVFGYHEVFHTFVCAAATCQYFSIALITARGN